MAKGKYTKSDLIDSIYDATGINRQDIKVVVDLMMKNVKSAIIDGNVVELRGFGTFAVRIRKGRSRARNPRTGDPIVVGSHGVPCWKPGRDLKRDAWNIPDDKAADENPASRSG
jgi:integration host factor subunit beta